MKLAYKLKIGVSSEPVWLRRFGRPREPVVTTEAFTRKLVMSTDVFTKPHERVDTS